MANVIDYGALSLATEASWYERTRQDVKTRSFISFRLGTEEYGIELLRLREIIKARPPTEVPRAPAFIAGVVSVRGVVMPVIDLSVRLGLGARTDKTRCLVVARGEELFALLVGDVREVAVLAEADIEPAPPMLARSEAEFIAGIGRSPKAPDRLIILLDLDAVLRFDLRRRKEALR